jgi:hypothetical protein
MRWLLQRKTLVENPRGAKDPATWMLPIDMGPKWVPEEGKEGWVSPDIDYWLFEAAGLHSGPPTEKQQEAKEYYRQLRDAIGGPDAVPDPASVQHRVIQNFAYVVGDDIYMLYEVIAEAQQSHRGLENLWFLIYNPRLISATPEARQRIFKFIRITPKEKRWRLQWLIKNMAMAEGVIIRFDAEDDFDAAMALPYEEFVRQFAPSKDDAWLEVFDRVPKKERIKALVHRHVVDFNPKAYLRAYKYLTSDPSSELPVGVHLDEADAVRGAVSLQFVFGNHWKKWIDDMWARQIDPHDATMWLPIQPSPGLDKFLRKHALTFSRGESGQRYARLGKPLEELTIIAKAWNDLEPDQRQLPYKQVLAAATAGTYEDARSPELALEASRWGIGEGTYGNIEDRWLEADRMQRLPNVSAEREGLRAFLLPKEDPRGLFLGLHTACCQEPEGAGSACAWWGVERPSSGFYVVEDAAGKIVAQSWTWKHGDVVVFDNIEGPAVQSHETRQTVIDLYGDLAVKILEADGRLYGCFRHAVHHGVGDREEERALRYAEVQEGVPRRLRKDYE